jgi:hypothetical protein
MNANEIVLAILGVVNTYLIYALTRFNEWKKSVDAKLQELDKGSISEDKFRKIIQEELQGFELRMIKEGRFEA